VSGTRKLKLTQRQLQIYELRHSEDPPVSYSRMEAILGISRGAINRQYHGAVKKMEKIKGGMAFDSKGPPGVRSDALERREPELAAILLDEGTQPLRETARRLSAKYGMPEDVIKHFFKRLDRQYKALVDQVAKPRLEDLSALAGARAKAILQSITPEDIEHSSLRDKAVAVSIFIEKHLLLEGRPTQIVETREEDEGMDQVCLWILEEAQRRGVTFDLDPVTGSVTRLDDPGRINRGTGAGRQHLIEDGLETPR
jgi:hypothetical protein